VDDHNPNRSAGLSPEEKLLPGETLAEPSPEGQAAALAQHEARKQATIAENKRRKAAAGVAPGKIMFLALDGSIAEARTAAEVAAAWAARGKPQVQPQPTLAESARRYAQFGIRVFPVAPRDKTPLVRWKDLATADVAQVERWWRQWPSANIGWAIPDEIVVLDVDVRWGADLSKEDDLRALEARAKLSGDAPDECGASVITGGGGRHEFYLLPDDLTGKVRNSAGSLGHGLDIRAAGGYVVLPPSIHASGHAYAWEGRGLEALTLAPDWLAAKLRAQTAPAPRVEARQAADDELPEIPEGQRDVTLTRFAGKMRRSGLAEDEILAALLAMNENRCKPPKDDADVRRIAASIARYKVGETPVSALAARRLRFTDLTQVQPQQIEWLWEPYIPFGKVTMVFGDGGVGKSTLMMAIAAHLSRGEALPKYGRLEEAIGDDGSFLAVPQGAAVNTLYLGTENGLADWMVPRLRALGADLTHIRAVSVEETLADGTSIPGTFTLADVEGVKEMLRHRFADGNPARLLIIDPITQFLTVNAEGRAIDFHRTDCVRPVLASLGSLAEEYRVAVVYINHLNKKAGTAASSRAMGSADLRNFPRSALLVTGDPTNPRDLMDPDAPTYFLVHHDKVAWKQGPTIRGKITDADGLEFLEPIGATGDETLGLAEQQRARAPQLRAASEFEGVIERLRQYLHDGAKPAEEIYDWARENDITKGTLRRAKKVLGVGVFRQGDKWWWGDEAPEPVQGGF
jgi:DNA repair protein RadA/Sms